MKNKKGFTIIELLAVIVILGLIIVVAIPAINKELAKFREKYYIELENTVKAAGQDYIGDKRFAKPKKLLNTNIIKASDISDKNYMDSIKDYRGHECDNEDDSYSYVVIVKLDDKKYEYQTCLKCSDDEYETDTSNTDLDLCNPAWLNNDNITYNGLSDNSDEIIWVYYGTDFEEIERQVGITYGVVKRDASGHEIATIAEGGTGKAKVIYPDNINELVSANLDTVVNLVYTLPSGEKVSKKAKMYRYGVPKITMKYKNGNSATGKAAGATYNNGADEWANNLDVVISYAQDDQDKYPEVISQNGIKRIEYYDKNEKTWKKVDSCNSPDTATCTWNINADFNKNVKLRIVDGKGNASKETGFGTIKVDAQKPDVKVKIEYPGTIVNGIYTGDIVVKLNYSDAGGSTLKGYGLIDSATPTYNSVSNITINFDVSKTYYGYAIDYAGNTNVDSKKVIRDTTPPVLNITMQRCTNAETQDGCATATAAADAKTWKLKNMRYNINVTEENMDRIEVFVNPEGTLTSSKALPTSPTTVIGDGVKQTYTTLVGPGMRKIKIVAYDLVGQKDEKTYEAYISKEFTITLNQGGGSGGTDKVYEVYGDKYSKANNDGAAMSSTANKVTVPSRTHYTFNGYFTTSTNTEKYIDNTGGLTSTADNKHFTANGTLYAQWTPVKYTLTYNSNGGAACNPTTKKQDYNAEWGTLCTPTRTNHRFDGWYTAASGGTQVSASTKVTGNLTVYAHWTETRKITYNNNGGTGTMNPTECVKGTSCKVAANSFTRTGHTFNKWNTKANGSGTNYNPGANINPLNNDVALYAQWKANAVTITLNQNGGTGGNAQVSATYGQAMPTTTKPTRTSYTFAGYWTAKSGGTRYYNQNGASVRNSDFTSTATLYARWFNNCVNTSVCTLKINNDGTATYTTSCPAGYTISHSGEYNASCTANTYKVVYNANGGSGSMSATTCTYGTGCKLTAVAFTKTGQGFSGWATSSGGNVAYGNGATVTNLTTTNGGTVNLYAKWANCGAGKYQNGSVCSSCPKGKYSTGTTNTTCTVCPKGKYAASEGSSACTSCPTGYNTSGTGSTKKADCTITCAANKRVGSADAQCTTSCSTGYTHAGHTVAAGSTSSACSAKTVTVTFNCNGGSGGGSQSFTYGVANQKFNKTCTRSGYKQTYWNTNTAGTGTNYSVASGVSDGWINSNSPSVTLYAKWQASCALVTPIKNGNSTWKTCWQMAVDTFGDGSLWDDYIYVCKGTNKSNCYKATTDRCMEIGVYVYTHWSYKTPKRCG